VPSLRDHDVPRERSAPCLRQSPVSGLRLVRRVRRHNEQGERHAHSVHHSVVLEQGRAYRGRWTAVSEKARLTLGGRDLRRGIFGRLRLRCREVRVTAGGGAGNITRKSSPENVETIPARSRYSPQSFSQPNHDTDRSHGSLRRGGSPGLIDPNPWCGDSVPGTCAMRPVNDERRVSPRPSLSSFARLRPTSSRPARGVDAGSRVFLGPQRSETSAEPFVCSALRPARVRAKAIDLVAAMDIAAPVLTANLVAGVPTGNLAQTWTGRGRPDRQGGERQDEAEKQQRELELGLPPFSIYNESNSIEARDPADRAVQ
jgi:hypothetical protein